MMKAMRRIVIALLAVGMALSFSACGSSEQYKAEIDQLNAMVDMYNAIDGCVASVSEVGTSYRLTLTVDCTGDALSVLSAHGLMEMEDSLKANLVQMESQGYTVVE